MDHCVVCKKMADVDFLGKCEPCFRDYVMNKTEDAVINTKMFWTDGHSGKISPAHLADIKRRKLGPDGKVYRDYGKRSFYMGK